MNTALFYYRRRPNTENYSFMANRLFSTTNASAFGNKLYTHARLQRRLTKQAYQSVQLYTNSLGYTAGLAAIQEFANSTSIFTGVTA